MPFMTRVLNLQREHGFTRKVACLITRVERGIDSLDNLAALSEMERHPLLNQSDFILISQFLDNSK